MNLNNEMYLNNQMNLNNQINEQENSKVISYLISGGILANIKNNGSTTPISQEQLQDFISELDQEVNINNLKKLEANFTYLIKRLDDIQNYLAPLLTNAESRISVGNNASGVNNKISKNELMSNANSRQARRKNGNPSINRTGTNVNLKNPNHTQMEVGGSSQNGYWSTGESYRNPSNNPNLMEVSHESPWP